MRKPGRLRKYQESTRLPRLTYVQLERAEKILRARRLNRAAALGVQLETVDGDRTRLNKVSVKTPYGTLKLRFSWNQSMYKASLGEVQLDQIMFGLVKKDEDECGACVDANIQLDNDVFQVLHQPDVGRIATAAIKFAEKYDNILRMASVEGVMEK